jgi:cation:H+ antiporter
MMWLQFIFSAAVIVAAGSALTQGADAFCERYRLGRFFIGILLLGMVTSLPELITSLVAVIRFHAPDLAVGNVMGSNNFNPLLLVAMDLVYRQGSVTDRMVPRGSHWVSASCALVLTLIVMTEIVFGAYPLLPGISGGLALVAVIYFAGLKILFTVDRAGAVAVSGVGPAFQTSSAKMWATIIVSSVLVTVSSVFLTGSAEAIAETTGWGRTFVGSLMLALVTSLPEAVVTISALRMGSAEMAVGNIFGSNMFNMLIVPVCGLFYRGGLILDAVSVDHAWTGFMSMVITGVVMWGICQKKKPVFAALGVDSWLMIAIFILGNYWIYGRP